MVCKVVVDGIIISCMVVLAGLLIATVNKLGLDEVVQWISFFESRHGQEQGAENNNYVLIDHYMSLRSFPFILSPCPWELASDYSLTVLSREYN